MLWAVHNATSKKHHIFSLGIARNHSNQVKTTLETVKLPLERIYAAVGVLCGAVYTCGWE